MLHIEEISRHIIAAKLEIELASKVLRGESWGDASDALCMLEEATKRLNWATKELIKAGS